MGKLILGETDLTVPLNVKRVRNDRSSWIEPAMDGEWPFVDKLRWHAGVLLHDHGLKVCVTEMQPGLFVLHGNQPSGTWGISACDFHDAWTYLNGMGMAAEMINGRKQ